VSEKLFACLDVSIKKLEREEKESANEYYVKKYIDKSPFEVHAPSYSTLGTPTHDLPGPSRDQYHEILLDPTF
jgi:hypothetical protein